MSFPIAIAFKENLMNAWSYRQAYIDFIFNQKYIDLYPHESELSEVTIEGSTRTSYRRQLGLIRSELINTFFNTSEKDFINANSNWALSADAQLNTLLLGYNWGVFYPAYNGSHR